MKERRVTPAAITALREALADIYWYKSDLRSFLTAALNRPELLSRLNWADYKRNIVGALVGYMAQHQEQYLDDLVRLTLEVAQFQDFSHLARLDDGAAKVRSAKEAVDALRQHVAGHEKLLAEQQAAADRRRVAYETALQKQAVRDRLSELSREFIEMVSSTDPHQRGYKLERLMKDLFELFDLDPKASFRVVGEQIDGAFTFDNTDYLFEGKWLQEVVDVADLDSFNGKIGRKLENTLGMFLAINGFAPAAVETHSSVRPSMILIDGSDLMAVLEGRIDLIELLLRKRRHASQTGRILLSAREILT
jgi:restriction endonuclease Mrr